MSGRNISFVPLTRAIFAPFGQVIDTDGANSLIAVNAGRATRFHDIAQIETTGPAARAMISIFRGTPYTLPLSLTLVERHPLGSQAFIPLHDRPFLVIVAPDEDGVPGTPLAFRTAPRQGININRNIWHGVLTPLGETGNFLVVDRGGDGVNLEEYTYAQPWIIED